MTIVRPCWDSICFLWGSSISIQQEPKQYFTPISHIIHPKPHGYIHTIIIPILQVRKLRPCKTEVTRPSLATQYWKSWIMKRSELHVCSKSFCYMAPPKRNLLKSTEKLKITGRPGDPGLELRATSVRTPWQPRHAQTTLQRALSTLSHTGHCLQNTILLPHHHHPGTVPHCPTSATCRVWKGVNTWWNHDHKAGGPGQRASLHREVRFMGSMGSQGPWGECTGFLGLLTESATNWVA